MIPRQILIAGLLLALSGTTAGAEQKLNAKTFDAYTRGKTMHYASGAQPYGIEQYLPDRKVVWSFVGDVCQEGYWYPKNDEICFVYADPNNPQCWIFMLGAKGLSARVVGNGSDTGLVAVRESKEPMPCAAPWNGV